MRQINVPVERACRVRQALSAFGFPCAQMTKLTKAEGLIRVNGAPATMRRELLSGDTLTVTLPEETAPAVPPKEIPLVVVYEDEHLLVLDKQAGLAVQPSKAHYEKSLFSALAFRYGTAFAPHVVTRLDRDTSGLMLVAKHSLCHAMLYGKTVQRRYEALLSGTPSPAEGEIDAPLALAPGGMKRVVSQSGKPALTRYRVREVRPNGLALVEAELVTGRTHQLRAHFASIGCPIAGDRLYGGEAAALFPRQALHSCFLAFTHPIAKRYLSFSSPSRF